MFGLPDRQGDQIWTSGEIPLDEIRISALNTRKDLDAGTEDVGIDSLADSIREKGLVNPVTVRETDDGEYELIAGQRRLLAFGRLRRTSIPAVVRGDLGDADATVLSLIENVQRADMHPLDKARAYDAIRTEYGSVSRVARETGVGQTTVQRYLKLLNLSPSIQDAITTSEGAAGVGTLSKLADTFAPDDQATVLEALGGFKQGIQQEILKRSDGDMGRLMDLRDLAMEGAFDVRKCSAGLCFDMPQEWTRRIKTALIEGTEVWLPAPGDDAS